MKIAFPTQENKNIESPVYSHFGSARFFIIVDAETGEHETIDNHDLNHAHGKCQPLVALGGKTVDAVVVGGIGGGALKKLTEEGVKTYRAIEGTVSENLSLIKDGKLPEFTLDHTCKGHQHGIGECVH
jgi:predicted Fe-Mo cluster-binding NifX family protein